MNLFNSFIEENKKFVKKKAVNKAKNYFLVNLFKKLEGLIQIILFIFFLIIFSVFLILLSFLLILFKAVSSPTELISYGSLFLGIGGIVMSSLTLSYLFRLLMLKKIRKVQKNILEKEV